MPNWMMVVGAIVTLLGAGGVGSVLATWLTHLRGKRKQTDDVALELVRTLEKRVEDLETSAHLERVRCDEKLKEQAETYDARLLRRDGQIGSLRHRADNQRLMIYNLLHLFDLPPARRLKALANIRLELASLEQSEAIEKGIIAAGGLVPEDIPGFHDPAAET